MNGEKFWLGQTHPSQPPARARPRFQSPAKFGISAGQTIAIDNGANQETAVIASLTGGGRGGRGGGGATLTVDAPLKLGHTAGATVSGTGIITLTAPLTQGNAGGAQVAAGVPTPGAPNQYYRKR